MLIDQLKLQMALSEVWLQLPSDDQAAFCVSQDIPSVNVIGEIAGQGLDALVAFSDKLLEFSNGKACNVKDLLLVLSSRNSISLKVRKQIIDALVLKRNLTGDLSWCEFANRFVPLKTWNSTDPRYPTAFQDVAQHMDNNADWDPGSFLEEYCRLGYSSDHCFLDFLGQVLHPRVRTDNSTLEFATLINKYLTSSPYTMKILGEIGGYPEWRGVNAHGTDATLAPAHEATLVWRVDTFKSALKDAVEKRLAGKPTPHFDDFLEVRRTLINHPTLQSVIPTYLKRARALDECVTEVFNCGGDHWDGFEPVYYVQSTLNQILDKLEDPGCHYDVNYELKEKLGQGGFGVVYKLYHRLLDMDFALKVYAPAFDDGSKEHEPRFYKEARILFHLSHDLIVRIYDVGNWNGRPSMRMEYVKGKPLDKFIAEHGRIPPVKALVLANKVALAMEYAHSKDIVHRDIKPGNIMVGQGGFVKVLDFGLAVYIEDAFKSRLTKVGERIAGGAFTAPELDSCPELIDPRSDIYSLGAVWFYSLTGVPPGPDAEMTIRSTPGVVSAYADAVMKCLRRSDNRFQTMSLLRTALEKLNSPGQARNST